VAATDRVERRLAAILAADIVGYSRLIEQDEARTLAAIRELRREVIDPLLAEHHGRVVKLMGDGAIIEFASVVDAVACAVAVQKGVAAWQTEVPSQGRIVFRIGVNLGDVVVEGDDLLGDGVNVAARLQQLCAPGGVLVAGTAYDHLQGKLDLPLAFAGEQHLKNIERPVRTYRLRPDGRRPSRRWRASPQLNRLRWAAVLLALLIADGSWWWLRSVAPTGARPSVAVLAFDNLSGDPEQGYLADGFAEDIITELARNNELTVLARTTSFSLKGQDKAADAAARTLGVRYVLDGSLRRTGDSLRLTAQLVDGASGRNLWAERYDVEAADIVTTQDVMARRVAATLFSEVRETEKAASLRRTPASLDVYELALRGLALKHQFSAVAFRAGRAALRQAIELDPGYAPAHAYLGYLDAIDVASGYTGEKRHEDLDGAIATVRHAIELDPTMAYAYQALGYALSAKGQPQEALRALERAVELGPNDADNQLFHGRELASNGRFAEAVAAGERAFALNPVAPIYYYGNHARSLYGAGQHEAVVKVTETCVDRRSYHRTCRAVRIAALGELGRMEQARAEARELLAQTPGFNLRQASAGSGYSGGPETNRRLLSRLREAGLPEG
jgi:TolB-like protein/class 3 adenylate cyclase